MSEREEAVAGRSRIWDVLWFFGGIFGALLLDGFILGVSALAPGLGIWLLLTIGLTQLIWLVPLGIAALIFRRTRFAGLGLFTGALLVFLLQAACYGSVMGIVGVNSSGPVEEKLAPPNMLELEVDADTAQFEGGCAHLLDLVDSEGLDGAIAIVEADGLPYDEPFLDCLKRNDAPQTLVDAIRRQTP